MVLFGDYQCLKAIEIKNTMIELFSSDVKNTLHSASIIVVGVSTVINFNIKTNLRIVQMIPPIKFSV